MNYKSIKFIIFIFTMLNSQIVLCQIELEEKEFVEYSLDLVLQDYLRTDKLEKVFEKI